MTGSLQDLLAVQDLDIGLDQLQHRRSHLAERAELTRLSTETAKVQQELAEVEAARAELAVRQAQTEGELAATEERAGAIDKRLYGGGATASRDLQAMSDELAHLKARASDLEDAVLAVMEGLEPLDRRAVELRSAIDSMAAERSSTEERLAESERQLAEEAAEITRRRQEAATVVPEPLLSTYENLRSRLGGVGVARLVGNHCDGCHLTLSAMELDQVRHLPEGQVYTCEQCSRILVP